jgi:hypothetical protein
MSTLSSGSHMMRMSTLTHRLVELLPSTSTHLRNSSGHFCRFQTMLLFLQTLLLISVLVLPCTDTQRVSSLTQPSLPKKIQLSLLLDSLLRASVMGTTSGVRFFDPGASFSWNLLPFECSDCLHRFFSANWWW